MDAEPRYDAILFDFDGVLIDSEPVHFACWREIIKPFGIKLDWDTYCEQGIGVSDRDLIAFLCRQAEPPLPPDLLMAEYPRKKETFIARMAGAEGALAEDVRTLLEELSLGYWLGVVTSSGRTEVEPILEAAGVRQLFDVAVFGGDVKRLKPAPDPYLMAVDRLGVKSVLVIEDSAAGLASARAAGLDAVAIPAQSQMVRLVREWLTT
jgi:beta-phosphoglucomutase